jgi:hypothetical protein
MNFHSRIKRQFGRPAITLERISRRLWRWELCSMMGFGNNDDESSGSVIIMIRLQYPGTVWYDPLMCHFTGHTTIYMIILRGDADRLEPWPSSCGFHKEVKPTAKFLHSEGRKRKIRSKSMLWPSFELAIHSLWRTNAESVATRIWNLMHLYVNSFRGLCKNTLRSQYSLEFPRL